MRKILVLGSVLAVASSLSLAQGPRGTASLDLNGGSVEIEYGRPSLVGRDMISLLRVGQTWRMGMNDPTTFTTSVPLMFGESMVPAGAYTLFARKQSAEQWQLLISSSGGGSDGAGDVAVVDLEVSHNESPVETLTIELESAGDDQGDFTMTWGHLKVSTRFMAH